MVLIIDFIADMPFPVNLYTALRYNFVRHSAEIKIMHERAAINVPARAPESTAAVAQAVASVVRTSQPREKVGA